MRNFDKKRVAAILGAVTLVVGVVAGRERPALELIHERAPQVAAAGDDGIDLAKLQRGEASLPQVDLFQPKGFAPAKPALQAAAKPSAPPLPFQFFGRLTEKGKTEVFVMRGGELLSIAPGQKLGDYRVDQVTESRIQFTYLPLKTKQSLDLPAVN
jgi:hypothetical protein